MCGIAGIIDTKPGPADKLRATLTALNAAMKHRGPDDEGVWMPPSGTAGLAHVRLSILDLSAAGRQPMSTADGGLHITFNGEIYNFRELRSELEREGMTFATHTDTEVLLRLYERDGPAMLTRLRGMFAFAIWDERQRRCFLARDPLGIKPLYYTLRGGRLAFASELRPLQQAGLTGGEIDPGALMRYFKTGSVAEPQTLLTDVHCLEAGHYLLWEAGRLAKRRYWQVEFHPEAMTADQAVTEVRAALLDTTRAHFVSDVPVGIFLSGGIDSTALTALARAVGQHDIATFSIGVDDAVLDESSTARRTAEHFGTRHEEMRLDADMARHEFTRFLRAMDQPSIDGFNTHTVAAFAHQRGMKVVLSGLGGDEMFGGYKSFDAVPRLAAAAHAARFLPGFGRASGWLLERYAPSHRARRIGSLLRSPAGIRDAYGCFRGIFSAHEAQVLAASYLHCSPRDIHFSPKHELLAADPRDAVSECELRFYMRNQLLKDSDVMSMAHGLELRVPLVDQALFRRVARVPAALRLRSGKQMLLDAVPEIPSWVSQAPKRGFVFPFEKWLGQGWGEAFARATARAPFKNPTWYQRWSIFMLDTWLERHGLH
ncbi:MAG TPA: asparagine synthase (glutamine-hydrolyzing) [Verrucomicrobiales bacterium]|nr:asparagine synthase (glutamine-hydrolyzing) [Verrucomicrobiales bacterium]